MGEVFEIFTKKIKGKIIYPIKFTHLPCVSITLNLSLNNQNSNRIRTNNDATIKPKSVNLFSGKKNAKTTYNKAAMISAGVLGKDIKLQNSRTVCSMNTPNKIKNDSLEKRVANTSSPI